MRAGRLLMLVVALVGARLCQTQAHGVRRKAAARMLHNLNDITRHLRDLSTSLGQYDDELRQAASTDPEDTRLFKRSSDDGLTASELRRKRRLLGVMRNVFDNAHRTLERQKKWATCNLNLGFTCQTEEYNDIADYYDFLNSLHSPGKKRSSGPLTLLLSPPSSLPSSLSSSLPSSMLLPTRPLLPPRLRGLMMLPARGDDDDEDEVVDEDGDGRQS